MDKEEYLELKDMQVLCKQNGDLYLKFFPLSLEERIFTIDCPLNIKKLMQKNMQETENLVENKEKFKIFEDIFIRNEYRRYTRYLDTYIIENCFKDRETIETIEVEENEEIEDISSVLITKEDIEILVNTELEEIFNKMYEEQLEERIITQYIGNFIMKKEKYYIPLDEEIASKDSITKNTKKIKYYICSECREKSHQKEKLGQVMIRYFCSDCNCEIKEDKAVQYGEKKEYYHHNCIHAILRRERDLKRQDIKQIIKDNEVTLKKFYYCDRCNRPIKEAVYKFEKKNYDEKCIQHIVEEIRGFKLTDEELYKFIL